MIMMTVDNGEDLKKLIEAFTTFWENLKQACKSILESLYKAFRSFVTCICKNKTLRQYFMPHSNTWRKHHGLPMRRKYACPRS